jgi:hypothetical protein
MTDTPAPPPFSFTRAKPKGETITEVCETHTVTAPAGAPPVERAARRKRGPNKPKPAQEAVSIKVDLTQAIVAAALLHEEDANGFAAVVKVLNGQSPASRKRISTVLGRIFG